MVLRLRIALATFLNCLSKEMLKNRFAPTYSFEADSYIPNEIHLRIICGKVLSTILRQNCHCKVFCQKENNSHKIQKNKILEKSFIKKFFAGVLALVTSLILSRNLRLVK
jgi:hypothetical protein